MPEKLTDRPSDYTFGKRKLRWPWVVGAGVLALAIIAVGGYLTFRNSSAVPSDEPAGSGEDTPTTTARVLDGALVDADRANYLPLAVIIENHSSVRPQSGLGQAGVVYEALAEGGITRFLAVFATNGDVTIGPVRSARPYFVQLAREYNGLFVHAGASPQATDAIATTKILDFNQFFRPYNFYRITGRAREHALFTDLRRLELGRKDMDIADSGSFTSWTYKDDAPVASPSVKPITIDFSTSSYKVSYAYDAAGNRYVRSQGGTVQKDKNDGSSLAPKNVAIVLTSSSLYDALRRNITVVGEGKLLLFRDGEVVTGTWKKPSAESRLQFLDSTGAPLALNRGQTWVEVVDVAEKFVTY